MRGKGFPSYPEAGGNYVWKDRAFPTYPQDAVARAALHRATFEGNNQWQPIRSIMPQTFVLVHGAWHGGWCWRRVADLLERQGHKVFTPTLTGLGERSHLLRAGINVSTHVTDVVNVLKWEGLSDVVLCGHSYGGLVVSGVAEQMRRRHRLDRVPRRLRAGERRLDGRPHLAGGARRPQGRGRARRPRRAGALGGGVPGQREGSGLGRRDVRAAADRHA